MQGTPAKRIALSAWLMAVVLAGAGAPASAQERPDWTRFSARLAEGRVDSSATVQTLVNRTVSGADSDVLSLLEATRQRPDWPAPARDSAVYRFTHALRELPAGAVSPTIVTYLKAYEPNTLVPHEDHPQGRVPLYNVRAAAAGLEHGWMRQEALLEGLALLKSNPRGLADAFALEGDRPLRAGYLQAVSQASPTQLQGVVAETARRLPANPDLTPLAARAAALAGDAEAIVQVLDHGAGPAVHRMLRSVADSADTPLLMALLPAGLGSANRESGALVLAELYPRLAGRPDADAVLLARLGDPDLGAGAALALARSPSLDTRLALEALAATTDRPVARRARLALDLREQLDLEAAP